MSPEESNRVFPNIYLPVMEEGTQWIPTGERVTTQALFLFAQTLKVKMVTSPIFCQNARYQNNGIQKHQVPLPIGTKHNIPKVIRKVVTRVAEKQIETPVSKEPAFGEISKKNDLLSSGE
eukprot:TRINITY_DN10298_c0_g1_i3.p2 TRINITY_DN10298_c0_g1~~TRINITY_DN10298_c0_g1_i3.p2  ORF type:complete len:120 (-),score=4.63 TRINITY_DN10298_c0_g1_i3:10-369(-)